MPTRTYNRFTGGVQQDDFLTNGPNFIEHNNVDGLRDGYALHLGPKVNKGVITNSYMTSIETRSFSEEDNRSIIGGHNGEIYRFDSTDNTPVYTLTNGGHILQIKYLSGNYFIFYKLNLAFANTYVAKVSSTDVENGTFASIDETFASGYAFIWTGSTPIVTIGSLMYFNHGFGEICSMNTSGTITTYGFPDDYTVGITLQGTIIMVYTRSGSVYQWDGVSTTYSAVKSLGFRVQKVSSVGGLDYITSEDGQLYVGSGFSIQIISKPKVSRRMNDNSVNTTRLRFVTEASDLNTDTTNVQNNMIQAGLGDVYLGCSDTQAGIYKYGKLNPQMQSGMHKIVTKNHAGTDIDEIYTLYFGGRGSKLYFCYKAGATYGVDYIDMLSLETCTDGYAITEVFSGNTSYEKRLNGLLRATSNTSGSNYIRVSYRANNGSWIVLRTINDSTDEITRADIKTINGEALKQNIDIQFKFEFHNDDGGEDSPGLHEFIYDYNLI